MIRSHLGDPTACSFPITHMILQGEGNSKMRGKENKFSLEKNKGKWRGIKEKLQKNVMTSGKGAGE